MNRKNVITADVLQAALDELDAGPEGTPPAALADEELFRSFVEDQILRLAGRLALCGADPALVQQVTRDVDHLVTLCVTAVHVGQGQSRDPGISVVGHDGAAIRRSRDGNGPEGGR